MAQQYDNLLRCIRCGLCLSVCPTYQETLDESESPRGRIAMARALVEGHLCITDDLSRHQFSCILCEACSAICPAGVSMHNIGITIRPALRSAGHASPLERLLRKVVFGRLFFDLRVLRRAARLIGLYQASGVSAIARRSGILRRLGLEQAERLMPKIPGAFIVPDDQRYKPDGPVRQRVALFAGCVMSTAFARVTSATARVLVANRCEVTLTAGQGCCGALHLHEGDREAALALARRNVDAFEMAGVDAIVVNAAGCGSTLKRYGDLLADDPSYAGRAKAFAGKVRDVHELLAALGLAGGLGRLDTVVAYHDACHLAHAQGIREAPRKLLAAIPGLRLVETAEPELCCGSGGLYNVTHSEMAGALLRRKVANVLATGADVVASANPGCMLQLEAGLQDAGSKVAVRHVIELLDDAYRKGEERDLATPTVSPTGK